MKERVLIKSVVEVEIDESKFTPEFMEEYWENFYQHYTIQEHIRHIGYLYSKGMLNSFTEGYGDIKKFGIRVKDTDDDEVEIL